MLRILIVDDQSNVRKMLTTMMRHHGFEAVGVEDAVSALKELETPDYDVAIVDIYMPRIDGVKLIKAIRERDPEFPIIAMSGVLLKESKHTALEYFPKLAELSGVVCLQKPFRPLDLLKAVQTALDGSLEPETSGEAQSATGESCTLGREVA
jgi:CheY-like chemotaxis protein